ncbi:MAG: hypothetical protein RLY86_321 [Pseudomonadota bacterium]|jgi:hypothetical protein
MSFPADIKACMKDCILAIIWPKKEIISFFRGVGCTSADLKQADDLQDIQNTRASIIDKVFGALDKREDNGLGQYRSMLKQLTEWNHFPDYYFNKLKKLDRGHADRLLQHLRQLQEIRDSKIREEDKKRRQQQERVAQATETISETREKFLDLYKGSISSQQRGYALEKVLINLARLSGLEVTAGFRTGSEQIDGAIKFEGEHYLVEAKWHDARASNEALYQMAGKILGKMYGRGIFISINGFSRQAVDSLRIGKMINMILIDGEDIVHIIEGRMTFSEMLDVKIRAAQTKGEVYVDAITLKNKNLAT